MPVLAGLFAFTVNGFALKSTPDFAIGAELTSVNFGGVGAMMTLHIPNVPLFVELAPAWLPVTSGGLATGTFEAQFADGFRI